MSLPAQEAERKTRGHAERKKGQVDGRREKIVLSRLANDDESRRKTAKTENGARQPAQAQGEQKVACNKNKRDADHEVGERQTV